MSDGCDRRAFLRAAMLIASGLWSGPVRAEGLRGCCIVPANAASAARTLWGNQPPPADDPGEILRRLSVDSGVSRGFERQLGRVLAEISGIFGVAPSFGFYDDATSPNACAVDEAVLRNTNGSVAFGRTMLGMQLELDNQGISTAAICAHEFGHVYQYRSGLYKSMTERYPVHVVELHADYLAGVYLHHLKKRRSQISLQGVGRAWEEMGPSQFTSDADHGTAAMRLDCIQAGYGRMREGGTQAFYAIANGGVDYVSRFASG